MRETSLGHWVVAMLESGGHAVETAGDVASALEAIVAASSISS